MPEETPAVGTSQEAPPQVEKTIEEMVDERLDAERVKLVATIRREFQTQFDLDIQKTRERMQEENRVMMDKVVADFRKEQTPPTHKEIQEMLDAEYISFPVQITWVEETTETSAGEETKETVTIGELAAANERKLLRIIKERGQPLFDQLSPALLNIVQGDATDKLSAIINLIEPGADILQDLVATILSAHSRKIVTRTMIDRSLSFNRQINVLTAQLEANRLRDFFSRVARISR